MTTRYLPTWSPRQSTGVALLLVSGSVRVSDAARTGISHVCFLKLKDAVSHSKNEPTLRRPDGLTRREHRDLVFRFVPLDEHHDHRAADRAANANADERFSDDRIEASERAENDRHRD